jgi:pyrimidine-nucleoside phosphorylase
MLAVELIAAKRDKKELAWEDIESFIVAFAHGEIPDYQMTAFLMATLLNGMTPKETLALTKSMMNSGKTLSWEDCDFPTVDKHSTGGVGDKTSLVLGPIVACYDVGVPMIAGRGLGHTGGTIDKLESIPGFSCNLTVEAFKDIVKRNHISIIAQTDDICPADKKIYGLRDVTATVESIPLICASIMSKKLAEGTDALVLDVKYGAGAFMTNPKKALELAEKLKKIGTGFKRKVSAFITTMDQPLGQLVGNSVEIEECISILKNEDSQNLYEDTRELSLILSAEMLLLTQKAKSFKDGYKMAEAALQNGKAYEKFDALVRAQGGNLKNLPKPHVFREVKASKSGFVKGFNTKDVGYASIEMGAGRLKTSDVLNPVAGIRVHKKIGDEVNKGDVLFTLMSDSEKGFEAAEYRLSTVIGLTPQRTKPIALVNKKI